MLACLHQPTSGGSSTKTPTLAALKSSPWPPAVTETRAIRTSCLCVNRFRRTCRSLAGVEPSRTTNPCEKRCKVNICSAETCTRELNIGFVWQTYHPSGLQSPTDTTNNSTVVRKDSKLSLGTLKRHLEPLPSPTHLHIYKVLIKVALGGHVLPGNKAMYMNMA